MQPGLQFLDKMRRMASICDLWNHVTDKERVGKKARDDFDV